MISVDGHLVKIEFKRVQEFLFAVPRLRNMIGANVMLGEMIRSKLPKLAQDCGSYRDLPQDGLQNAATISNDDPLTSCEIEDHLKDDPVAMYKLGILSRDGGHFTSVFPDKESATQFSSASEKTLSEKLPGLRFEIIVKRIADHTSDENDRPVPTVSQRSLIDLPVFQVCEESGNGPASFLGEGRPYSGHASSTKLKAKKFRDGLTEDIVGLLRHKLPLNELSAPQDFHDLCSKDYLAVVYADGNQFGNRFKLWKQSQKLENNPFLLKETIGEKFWHSCRVSMRRSLIDSLNATFKNYNGEIQPYQILMLGGDDLLLVCQAKYALRFAVELSKCLEKQNLSDGEPLTVGVGIAIASPNYPFYALQRLAEELGKSSKKLYARLPSGEKTSVVDWLVCTSSWSENPDEFRTLHFMKKYRVGDCEETLALSSRPYKILGKDVNCLEGLLQKAADLNKRGSDAESGAARSQLRFMVSQLDRGRSWSELCFKELPENCKESLRIKNLWDESGPNKWKTVLFDLVDVSEIEHLGTNPREQGSRQ